LSHEPVLFDAVLQALGPRPDGTYIDCTFGRGGHTRGLLQALAEEGRVIAIDRDPEAVAAAREMAAADPRLVVRHRPFSGLGDAARELGVAGEVDGILMDLGVSSPQFDTPERGFSFRHDGPLDMRMDPTRGESAADFLARAGHGEIARVIKLYGEEPRAGRIAAAILRARAEGPIRTTGRLARVVSAAVGRGRGEHLHPATRVFQALRIHVNRELEELEAALGQSLEVLGDGGRLAVISFHSLEDRIVKRFLRDAARGPELPRGLPVTAAAVRPELRLVGKPVRPDAAEVESNPRARSAILRVAERVR
jgi:16S rRNA (cytosine1402-N4)-methyltransferase